MVRADDPRQFQKPIWTRFVLRWETTWDSIQKTVLCQNESIMLPKQPKNNIQNLKKMRKN